MTIDFHSLKLFRALAQNLHFGRTSAEMNTSASALSRSIRRLEDELGVTLLTRNNRSVSLTPQGSMLKDYVDNLLKDWEEFRARLDFSTHLLSGKITLFASVTASQTILPVVLTRFRQKYPDVSLQLETGYAVNAIKKLREGCDLVIAALPDKSAPDIARHVIAETPLVTIAPADLDDSGFMQDQTKLDWSQIPLILPTEGQARQDIENWLSRNKISPLIYSEVAGNEAVLSLVALGCGVGFVPRLVLDMSPLSKGVRVISTGPAFNNFLIGFCATHRSLANNPLIKAFWDELGPEQHGE